MFLQQRFATTDDPRCRLPVAAQKSAQERGNCPACMSRVRIPESSGRGRQVCIRKHLQGSGATLKQGLLGPGEIYPPEKSILYP